MLRMEIEDFTADAYSNGEFVKISKKDLLGKWSVLFFYPGDFTFVCPTELADLQDNYEEFKKLGCEIYSISMDSHFVHKAWHDSSDRINHVTYPMIGDPNGQLTKMFSLYSPADGMAERGTIVINPEGKVASYEVVSDNIGRNAEELIRKVAASQFVYEHGDQVCPAKWKPGAETLKPTFDLVGKL
ncbi:alkyl hydroperoxide reductase subunit C [Dialister pneumosintes]|uniref:Alkyl hydroperoxide reductase C n=1 Tax=Dialister pneumosintes TaxID=39950 RepID=A0A1B3WF51_9FIRM|nr:alkyl hydroperoxide reductase subunit C [Dialister pneumosintes]AOH39589.1 peroxiredoxin [Dialister pneumosintes]